MWSLANGQLERELRNPLDALGVLQHAATAVRGTLC